MSGENLTSDSQTQQANTCPWKVVIPDDAQPEQEQTTQQANTCPWDVVIPDDVQPEQERTAQQANTCPWDIVIPDDTQPEQEQTAQLNDQQYTESNNNYVDIPQGTQNADNRQNRTQLVVSNSNGYFPATTQENYYATPLIQRFGNNSPVPYKIPVASQIDRYSDGIMTSQMSLPFMSAGLTSAHQELANKKYVDAELDIYQEARKSSIRLCEHQQKRLIDWNFMVAKDDYETQKRTTDTRTIDSNHCDSEGQVPSFKSMEQSFKTRYALVKVRIQGNPRRVYAMRSSEYNRHIYMTEKSLSQEYLSFIEEKLPENMELSQVTFNRSLNRLLHSVSKLEDSGLKVLESHQVMFLNGYFDVKTGKFYPVDTENHNQYFNTYSIEINFKQNALLPKVFNKMLRDMLGGNDETVRLAYEQIGALLTPIPILKKIIVFQGKSQGGKTRLSNIIQNLFTPDDIYPLDAISQMTTDKLARSSETPITMIYVKELGKNKLASEQIRSLKAFADGSNRLGGNPKILLNTNYAIYTGKGIIEPALKNRLSVLPFPKAMSNSDPDVVAFEDMYFETEKDDIILYSLQQFHFALQKGNKFSVEFPVNACIEDDSAANSELTPSELQSINQVIANPSQLNTRPKFNQVLDKMFSLTKEVNPDMPAKFIMMKINEVLKDEVENTASLGKRLRSHFCDKLLFKRIRNDMCYNLAFRDNTELV